MSKSRASAPSLMRTVMQSVTVGRNGQVVVPTIGYPFEFTADEIAQIEKANPAAISTIATLDLTDEVTADAVKTAAGDSGEGSL
jgi:hypothetical protein